MKDFHPALEFAPRDYTICVRGKWILKRAAKDEN